MTTVAQWKVHAPVAQQAKNVILFIGDGMPQSAVSSRLATSLGRSDRVLTSFASIPSHQITAARLLGHKSINGKYQSTMQLDKMDTLGLQMTHSIDVSLHAPRTFCLVQLQN